MRYDFKPSDDKKRDDSSWQATEKRKHTKAEFPGAQEDIFAQFFTAFQNKFTLNVHVRGL